ncbi:hypothetical protein [Bradyrhizobium quebecense]|uniref:Uncharacterized protein n=2 Tax=Bradyrhizobium quebecense TaxID=2748629 RepID=A0ACD3VMC4_9BRAD|nr:hypothetical protein [Bradyrhizobium quebecense]UGY07433.1 hypothetical protein J4P68_0040375 [Bradyrhizobium quebecense]
MLEIKLGFLHGIAQGPFAIGTLALIALVVIFAIRYRVKAKTSKASKPSLPYKSKKSPVT